MTYRLIVLTHGETRTLNEAISSFTRNVRPAPDEAVLVYDGPPSKVKSFKVDWKVVATGQPLGFCGATAKAWEEAAVDGVDKVFWLEHDFTFRRPVDLDVIAAVMDEHPDLSQMALYRNPVNSEEIAHGGYLTIPARSGEYTPRVTPVEIVERLGVDDYETYLEEMPWFEHRGYWTTNPSLIRRDVISEFDWPTVKHCEGMFAPTVKAGRPGTTFGLWGDGGVWVDHIGVRDGFGY